MKALTSYLSRFFPPAAIVILVQVGLSLFSTGLRAGETIPTPVVGYDATIVQIQGQFPFRTTYTFNLQAPSNLTALLAGGGPAAQISFSISMNGKPSGVSDLVALGYVTIATPIVSFSFSGQIVPVTVTLDVPSDAVPGPYGYKILSQGWPVDPALGLTNVGEFINATVTAPAAVYTPPDVVIGTPQDNWTTTVNPIGFPVSVPLTFTATSTGTGASPITDANVTLGGNPVTLSSLVGLSTTSVTGSGNMSILSPGTYTVVATANNKGGPGADTNTFTINVNAPMPTAAITTPAPGTTYTYRTGGTAVSVPFVFTGNSTYGAIRSLTATIDNVDVTSQFVPTGIGSLSAGGRIDLSYTSAGTHTLHITASTDYGTAVADSDFTVVVVSPLPVVTITAPALNSNYTIPSGATSMTIPFSFGTVTNTGFTVDTVSATLDGNPVTITTNNPAALGTSASVTSTGTLLNVGVGTHTLIATGTSGGVVDTDTVTFTVVSGTLTPPSVVINTPVLNSIYTITLASSGSCNGSVTVPLNFVGTSNTTNGVITKLTATLDGKPVGVTSTTINQKNATGTASLVVTTAGTHTIGVTATDAVGTASATRTFKVVVVYTKTICGRVFFDLNFNGVFDNDYDSRRCSSNDWNDSRGCRNDQYSDRGDCRDSGDRYYSRDSDSDSACEDFGLGGITVKLLNAAGVVIGTQVSDASGNYCFSGVEPGNYTVTMVVPAGYGATTLVSRAVTVSTANVCVRDFGLGLKFTDIDNLCASGKPSEYWKTQIDKCIKGDRSAEVSSTTCNSHTKTIGSLSLSVYDGITIKTCSSTLGTTSTGARDQLAKQLLAAEYNYANGSYINGNKMLTYCFIQWGERVHKNTAKYSTTYCTNAANWMKAYNCSQGGRVDGPQ